MGLLTRVLFWLCLCCLEIQTTQECFSLCRQWTYWEQPSGVASWRALLLGSSQLLSGRILGPVLFMFPTFYRICKSNIWWEISWFKILAKFFNYFIVQIQWNLSVDHLLDEDYKEIVLESSQYKILKFPPHFEGVHIVLDTLQFSCHCE